MRIEKPDQSLILFNYGTRDGVPHLHVTLGFLADHSGNLYEETEAWRVITAQFGNAGFDEAYKKRCGTFTVAGCAYAQPGAKVSKMGVVARVGTIQKNLHVFGDRRWEKTLLGYRATAPIAFESMPVDLAHAFGGASWPANEGGRGHYPSLKEADQRLLANIELPQEPCLHPADCPSQVATFSPLPQGVPARMAAMGTFDGRWLKKDVQSFPSDTDPAFFDAVQKDQCNSAFWRGDETYEVHGMHPEQAMVQGTLPGLRVRVLYRCQSGVAQIHQASLDLDTVLLLPNVNRVLVLYRALLTVGKIDGADVETLFVHCERLWEPLTPHEELVTHFNNMGSGPVAVAASEVLPSVSDAPAVSNEAQVSAASDALWKEIADAHDSLANQATEIAKQKDVSLDWPALLRPDPALPVASVLDPSSHQAEVENRIAAAITEIDATREAVLRQAGNTFSKEEMAAASSASLSNLAPHELDNEASQEIKTRLQAVLAERDARLALIEAELAKAKQAQVEPAAEFATEDEPKQALDSRRYLCRDEVVVALAAGDSLQRVRLEDVDLSALDCKGINFSDSEFLRCTFKQTQLAGASFAKARITACDFTGADLRGIVATEVIMDNCILLRSRLEGADIRYARIANCDFSNAVAVDAKCSHMQCLDSLFTGVDCSGACADGASFLRCNLSGLLAFKATFEGASFESSKLDAARFNDTVLNTSSWWKVSADSTDFIGASMVDARLGNGSAFKRTRFVRANCTGASIQSGLFEHCDMTEVCFNGALLTDCTLCDVNMCYVDAREASFMDSRFERVDLTGANLMQATLRRATLNNVVLDGANVHGTDTHGATLGLISLRGALLTRTALAKVAV